MSNLPINNQLSDYSMLIVNIILRRSYAGKSKEPNERGAEIGGKFLLLSLTNKSNNHNHDYK